MPAADILTVEKYGIDASLPYSDDPARADCPLAYVRHDSLAQRAADRRRHRRRAAPARLSPVVALGGSEGPWSRTCWRRARIASRPPSPSMAAADGSSTTCCTASPARPAPRARRPNRSGACVRFARHVRTATPAARRNRGQRPRLPLVARRARHGSAGRVAGEPLSGLDHPAGADDSVSPRPCWPWLPGSIRRASATSPTRPMRRWTTACAGPMDNLHMAEVVDDMAAWLQDAGIVP